MSYEQRNSGHRRRWGGRRFLFYPLGAAAIALLLGAAVQALWNHILPAVTGVGTLSYWQAVGLLVLSRILFGGWRGGRPHRGGPPGRWGERWGNMSPEDRARLKQEWRERCRRRDAGEDKPG